MKRLHRLNNKSRAFDFKAPTIVSGQSKTCGHSTSHNVNKFDASSVLASKFAVRNSARRHSLAPQLKSAHVNRNKPNCASPDRILLDVDLEKRIRGRNGQTGRPLSTQFKTAEPGIM